MNMCIRCGHVLPPLNGVEENDFAILCELCEHEHDESEDE